MARVKKEFNKGDTAYLTNNKRGKGFTLEYGSPVEITGSTRIADKAGGYLYSFNAINPKTGEKVSHSDWLTQFDFMTKAMAEETKKLEELLKEKGIR